jgi:hypothetical protein
MAATKQITFPVWPTWNFQFAERDLMLIHSVKYHDEKGHLQELPADHYRLAIGHNGVSALVLLHKGLLPQLAERNDAVIVEYEP